MKINTRIKAITLDAAGTLIQVARPIGECYANFANEFEIPVTADQINRQFRILFPRMMPLAFGQCNPAELGRQERQWWQTLVRNCLGTQGRHKNFSKFFEKTYNYYASAEAWRLFPEVISELEKLHLLGLPVSMVSNFDSRLIGILQALGIHQYFRHIHISSQCGFAKPHPGIFSLACEGLGTSPGNTLHIGDNYKLDIEGAEQAGLKALWLDRSAQSNRGQTIATLNNLSSQL